MEIRAVSLLTNGAQPPQSNCQIIYFRYSEFDRSRDVSTCRDLPVLYPLKVHLTLAQKLFRREPAITRLGQLFTSYHKSSKRIAQLYRSVLPPSFDGVQPVHGKLALVSGLMITTYALFTLGFPMAPPLQGLAGSKHQLVGSFFNRHAVTDRTLNTNNFYVHCATRSHSL